MAELTHINEQGRAKMVDVSEKADTKRIGVASGRICMQPETFALITDGKIKKGDLFGRKLYFVFQGAAPEQWMLEAGEYTMKRFAAHYGLSYGGMMTNRDEAAKLTKTV